MSEEQSKQIQEAVQKAVDKMKGFKRHEVQPCLLCGEGVAHDGNIDFYRISLERFFLDAKAIRRQHGLELMLGGGGSGAKLAGIFGPDEDFAKEPSPHPSFLVCGSCAFHKKIPIALMAEREAKRSEGEE